MRLALPVQTTCALCGLGLVWCASPHRLERSKQSGPPESPQQVQQVRKPADASSATGIAAVETTPTGSTNGPQEPATRDAAANGSDGGISQREALYDRGLG